MGFPEEIRTYDKQTVWYYKELQGVARERQYDYSYPIEKFMHGL